MGKNKVCFSMSVLSLCALMMLAGCSRQKEEDRIPNPLVHYSPAYGDAIVEGTIADPAILNPVLASDSASFEVIDLVFSSLLKMDKDLNLVGDVAKSWKISPDGKVITFYLKENVKFHDGAPLTANDVQFTIATFLDPKIKTAYRSNFENITKTEVINDYTFRVTYREPFAPSLERIGGMAILPRHLLKGRDINTADDFNFKPIGSGPYKFVKWTRAESVVLKANAEYFDSRPYLNRVVFRIIPDSAVEFLELQNGGLDMMSLTPDQYTGEASTENFEKRFNKYRYPASQYTYLGFNLRKDIFKDKRFRQAIDMAIDKKALVKSVLDGLGQESTGPFTPNSWAFNPEVKPEPFDPLRAREILTQQLGYTYKNDGMLYKNNRPLELTIQTNQGNRNREQSATIIQAQLKEIGIKVNIRIIAWSTFLDQFINKRKFDMVLMGWSLPRDPDNYAIFHSSQTKEHEFNFLSYKNPEVDRLLEEARVTYNKEKRKRMYYRVHALIAADLPCVFLYVPDSLPCVHRRILGIDPGPAGIGYNFTKWFVPEGYQKYAK